MSGFGRFLAGVLAFFTVIVIVFLLFTNSLVYTLRSRTIVQNAITVEPFVGELTAALFVDFTEDFDREYGLTTTIDPADISKATALIVPSGWVDATVDEIIDGFYDFLESGDLSRVRFTLDMRPLITRLEGEPGVEAAVLLLNNIPTCPNDSLDLIKPEINGLFQFNCLPAQLPVETAVRLTQRAVVQNFLAEDDDGIQDGVWEVAIFQNASKGAERDLRFIQRLYQESWWAWAAWLFPVMLFSIITLCDVYKLPDIGRWWGKPLIWSGGITLVLLVVLGLLLEMYFTSPSFLDATYSDPLEQTLIRAIGEVLNELKKAWLWQVGWRAAALVCVGAAVRLITERPRFRNDAVSGW